MSKLIKVAQLIFRTGLKADLPILEKGEPGLATDTEQVLIGTGSENIELAKKGDLDQTNASLTQNMTQIGETGYGIITGGEVEQQTTPNMTVKVKSLLYHSKDGKRYSLPETNISISPSSPTLRRRDLLYVDNSGTIKKLEGVPSSEGVPPTEPSDAIALAIVTIKEGVTSITKNQILLDGKRKIKLTNDLIQNELQLVKNNNAISIRPSDGIITKMLNYAQGYIKNKTVFAYGGNEQMFIDDMPSLTSPEGKHYMSCSTFCHLMAKGISFENSKFNGLQRNILDPNFNDDYKVTIGFVTFRWGKWLYENGFTFKPNADWSNVVASDMLIISYKNQSSQLENHDMAFMGFDHSAIFVERNPDGSVVVYEQASNQPQFRTYSKAQIDGFEVTIVRLPYSAIDLDIKNMVLNGDTQYDVTGVSTINTYKLNKNLKPHKWYTVVIKGAIRTQGCFFSVRCGANTVLASGRLHGIKPNGLYTYHFTTGDLDISAQDIRILISSEVAGTPPDSEKSAVVDWVVLTEGFTNSITEFIDGGKNTNNVVFTLDPAYTGYYNTYYNDKFCLLNVRITNPSTIADNALITVGTFTGTTLKNNMSLKGDAFYQLSASPSYSDDVYAWVATDTSPYRLRVKNGTAQNKQFLDISVMLPI